MTEDIYFWLAKQIAELLFAAGVLLLILIVYALFSMWATWQDRRKGARQ